MAVVIGGPQFEQLALLATRSLRDDDRDGVAADVGPGIGVRIGVDVQVPITFRNFWKELLTFVAILSLAASSATTSSDNFRKPSMTCFGNWTKSTWCLSISA